MYKLFIVLLFLITSSAVEARWKYNADRDPFTDEKASTAIKTNPGFSGGSLIVRCKDGYLESYYNPSTYLGSDKYSTVRYRFDKIKAEQEVWSLATSGKAVFAETAVEFARQIIAKSSLVIDAEDFSGEKHISRFSLSGSSGPVSKVLADCKLMSRDPRSIDPDIWRRVVHDLDKISFETADKVSFILGISEKPEGSVGDRKSIKLYKKLSNFYVNVIIACEFNPESLLKLESCKKYRQLIAEDNNADYPLEAIDLLIEFSNSVINDN